MDSKQLEQCVKRLHSTVPLLGKGWRQAAIRDLAADRSAESLPHLIWALESPDEEVRPVAHEAVRGLSAPGAVDALCEYTIQNSKTEAARICIESRYVPSSDERASVYLFVTGQQEKFFARDPDFILLKRAYGRGESGLNAIIDASAPESMRLLSICWAGKDRITSEQDLGTVIGQLGDSNPGTRYAAVLALKGLTLPVMRNTLCECAILEPGGEVARICVESGFVPADEERACVLLFVTRQLDAFLARDTSFANLRRAYGRADQALKAIIDGSMPERLRLLSVCWTGKDCITNEGDIAAVVSLLSDKSTGIRIAAAAAIKAVTSSALQNSLCDLAILEPKGELARICAEAGFAPSDDDRACLYLFVTNQLTAFFARDPDFARLKSVYAGANAELRAVIDAAAPEELRPLGGCWSGESRIATQEDIAAVARLLQNPQKEIGAAARAVLKGITRARLQSGLCDLAISEPGGEVARICIDCGYEPIDDERACVYLFVTRQLDAFFERDPDFAHLHLEYSRADAPLKSAIMEVLQAGDPRCGRFFGRNKQFNECTDEEIVFTLNSARSHAEWESLWGFFKELPLRLSQEIPDWLSSAGWRPDDEDEALLYDEIVNIRASSGSVQAPSDSGVPSVLDAWIEQGKTGDMANSAAPQLLERLKTAAPPEGVQIVGALSTKIRAGGPEALQLEQNSHWMVRLAAYAVGLATGSAAQDPNIWVRELAGAAQVMNLWPSNRTPGVLRGLTGLPAEAFIGKLGIQRRMAIAIISFGLDRATFVKPGVTSDVPVLERK